MKTFEHFGELYCSTTTHANGTNMLDFPGLLNRTSCSSSVLSYRASSAPGLLRSADVVLGVRGMEGSTDPKNPTPVQAEPSSHLRSQQNQTDSFLTAARLLRGGWLEEPSTPRCQSSSLVSSIKVLNPAEVWSRNSKSRTAGPSGDECSEADQTPEGPVSVRRQTDRAGRDTGGASVRISGCRMACRQSRRFKAPVLPAITEI